MLNAQMQKVTHFGGVGLGSLELFASADGMLVVAFAPIGAEDVDDTLNIGRERPRLANGFPFLGLEAKPATVETNLFEDQALLSYPARQLLATTCCWWATRR